MTDVNNPASLTGGVKAFSLEGRLYRERERLAGMTEEERCWRAKWIRDQKFTTYVRNEELFRELHNPFRRMVSYPLDCLYRALRPAMGDQAAYTTRRLIGGLLITIQLGYASYYYLKYNANDWTRKGGWRILHNRPILQTSGEGFPSKYDRNKQSDYASRGFQNSPI